MNAEKAIKIANAHNLNISNNTLLTSRSETMSVVQTNSGSTYANTFAGNTFLQKNPDYPYIEMRDEVGGSNAANTFVSANGNFIYPNYKPNTSYIRSVNF